MPDVPRRGAPDDGSLYGHRDPDGCEQSVDTHRGSPAGVRYHRVLGWQHELRTDETARWLKNDTHTIYGTKFTCQDGSVARRNHCRNVRTQQAAEAAAARRHTDPRILGRPMTSREIPEETIETPCQKDSGRTGRPGSCSCSSF